MVQGGFPGKGKKKISHNNVVKYFPMLYFGGERDRGKVVSSRAT